MNTEAVVEILVAELLRDCPLCSLCGAAAAPPVRFVVLGGPKERPPDKTPPVRPLPVVWNRVVRFDVRVQ